MKNPKCTSQSKSKKLFAKFHKFNDKINEIHQRKWQRNQIWLYLNITIHYDPIQIEFIIEETQFICQFSQIQNQWNSPAQVATQSNLIILKYNNEFISFKK